MIHKFFRTIALYINKVYNRTVCKEIKEAKSGNKKKRRHYDL